MLMRLVTGCKALMNDCYIKIVFSHFIVVKQVLKVSDKMNCFDYKGGCIMEYSKPFHKRLNCNYTLIILG